MSEAKGSQSVVPQESLQSERVSLKLAAGAVAGAYYLDCLREYPPKRLGKVSSESRANAWQKAEMSSPQFTDQIVALGSAIPESQRAREQVDYHLRGVYTEVADPVAREFLFNILMIRLGSSSSIYAPLDAFRDRGNLEMDRVRSSMTGGGYDLTTLSVTDVAEAYLDGLLTVVPPPSEPPSL